MDSLFTSLHFTFSLTINFCRVVLVNSLSTTMQRGGLDRLGARVQNAQSAERLSFLSSLSFFISIFLSLFLSFCLSFILSFFLSFFILSFFIFFALFLTIVLRTVLKIVNCHHKSLRRFEVLWVDLPSSSQKMSHPTCVCRYVAS